MALISVVVSIIAALASGYFAFLSHSTSLRSEVAGYKAQLREWASDVSVALADLRHLLEEKNVDQRELGNVLSKISGLIEHGRLFFPNTGTIENIESIKSAGYRSGLRDKKLDPIVAAYSIGIGEDLGFPVHRPGEAVWKLHMIFTEQMQSLIDPCNHHGSVEELSRLEPGDPHQTLIQQVLS